MDRYELQIRPSVSKDVGKIPKAELKRILERISSLREQPRPAGRIKLSGREYYRIRQGEYRVVYEIDDGQKIFVIAKIGHRKDIYRH